MRTSHILSVLLLLFFSRTLSQEIDCEITLNLESLTKAEARDNLVDFAQQVKQYINAHRWTDEDFGDEKVRCAISISIQSATGDNHYIAQTVIGSQRQIYKSARNTPVIRLRDDGWEFDYIRNQTLIHSASRFDPLLSLLDFYMYIILGYDADTYSPSGGTPYFQKAQDVVNLARGASTTSKGWEQTQQSQYSRTQLVDELLNPKFQDFRKALYSYHYRGLDSLFTDSAKPLRKILTTLGSIRNLSERINQPSLIIRTFFDTKYLEIAEIFMKYGDPGVFSKLSKIDRAHQKTYDEYGDKLK